MTMTHRGMGPLSCFLFRCALFSFSSSTQLFVELILSLVVVGVSTVNNGRDLHDVEYNGMQRWVSGERSGGLDWKNYSQLCCLDHRVHH